MNNQSSKPGLMRNKDGTKFITVEEFDRLFDEGSDEIDDYLDWDSFRRPGLEIKRVNVDLPQWMIDRLDREARRIGVPRQAVIKMWLAERLDAAQPPSP
jgi:hypothetical protein